MPNAWVLVPAAGCGERFGDECPKQFSLVHGHTLISYTISSLLACEEVKKVIVVTSDQTRVGDLPSWWYHVLDASDQVTSGSQPKPNYKNSADKPDGNAMVRDCVAGLDKNDDLSVDITDKTFSSEYQITKPLAESRVIYVPGSTSRHRSIKCGLDAINQLVEIGKETAPDVVLVHDGVRPLVPAPLVSALVTAAAAHGAAGLTRPLVSTVLETPAGQRACLGRSLDRSRHRASETPQAFTYSVIRRAYQQCSEQELDHGTECLQLALTHAGVAARLLDGSPDLWKVTYRRDLHAFRGVLDDTVVRPAIVSTDLTLDDMRDSLVRLLSPRLPRATAVSSSELVNASYAYSSLVLIRSSAAVEISSCETADRTRSAMGMTAQTETLTVAASHLNRCLPGYVVDLRVGRAAEGSLEKGDEFHRQSGKWLCCVDCTERPVNDRRLAALLTSILISEEGAFHGQVLRL